ncbi:MAG: hypothetical protein ACJ8I9_05195, partial [Chthoniobacterales bacterium]
LVPGGLTGAVIAGVAGIAITIFAMIVALIPPAGTTQIWLHELKLAGGSLFLIALGVVIYRRARPSTVAN